MGVIGNQQGKRFGISKSDLLDASDMLQSVVKQNKMTIDQALELYKIVTYNRYIDVIASQPGKEEGISEAFKSISNSASQSVQTIILKDLE